MLTNIKIELRNEADSKGLHQVRIRVIYNRAVIRVPVKLKVKPENFDNGEITGMGKLTKAYNNVIHSKVNEIEAILLKAFAEDAPASKVKEQLTGEPATYLSLRSFVDKLIKDNQGKLSKGRLKHYNSVCNKIEGYFKNVKLSDIDDAWMTKYENKLREKGNGQNTINTNMKIIIAILHAAEKKELIKYPLKAYKKPAYIQNIPEYLTEAEIEAFKKATDGCSNITMKTAGYYYLLGYYTGFRISDLQAFKYAERVKEDNILLRAKKNGQIVSIPLYGKLKEVLEVVKSLPFDMSEQAMREHVKTIAGIAGIKRKVKVHSSRHGFCVMLMQKGFTIDEVSELIGDSKDVARVYARVTNMQLSQRIKDKLN